MPDYLKSFAAWPTSNVYLTVIQQRGGLLLLLAGFDDERKENRCWSQCLSNTVNAERRRDEMMTRVDKKQRFAVHNKPAPRRETLLHTTANLSLGVIALSVYAQFDISGARPHAAGQQLFVGNNIDPLNEAAKFIEATRFPRTGNVRRGNSGRVETQSFCSTSKSEQSGVLELVMRRRISCGVLCMAVVLHARAQKILEEKTPGQGSENARGSGKKPKDCALGVENCVTNGDSVKRTLRGGRELHRIAAIHSAEVNMPELASPRPYCCMQTHYVTSWALGTCLVCLVLGGKETSDRRPRCLLEQMNTQDLVGRRMEDDPENRPKPVLGHGPTERFGVRPPTRAFIELNGNSSSRSRSSLATASTARRLFGVAIARSNEERARRSPPSVAKTLSASAAPTVTPWDVGRVPPVRTIFGTVASKRLRATLARTYVEPRASLRVLKETLDFGLVVFERFVTSLSRNHEKAVREAKNS
ncbi:hypothetical protein BIW11_04619 [Tropilaelaps mercedesae]|uniref:Uncharacterized protein n=1 Tax=Tropilaelaps mercedesae TaxID=418985 RepID=A0A1V9X3C1_9ACAR|nr:hypothetical protein BIW11_04619 [Tropilaelaps mercedesae]